VPWARDAQAVSSGPGSADGWDRAAAETVALLRELIRIPSVNPPSPDLPDGELRAARLVAEALSDAGIPSELHEPVPGRGSVTARLRGDGTGGPPLLLLSHVDVVPASTAGWTHAPFAADVADGYVWGRGAVDMKAMVAMEVEVFRLLARRAREAGRDPAADAVPGLRRDVLFAATADEEAGGHAGAGWLAAHRPETLRAAGALNECGGVSIELAGRRLYPIQVAEKGFAVYRISVRGTWGHGSMPRDDNAAVRAAHAVTRLATPGEPRLTGPMERLFAELGEALPADRQAGRQPVAIVATIGTTSSTAIDPVAAIADVAEREGLWLHVDAAYAGWAAMLSERRIAFSGWERADSVVVNPHKWLFTPLDASLLLTRRLDALQAAFSLRPEYLRTLDREAPVRDFNEYQPQLGRRMRALKLWLQLRWFGLEGLRRRLRSHLELAARFAGWVDEDAEWERLAPAPFSTVCFRFHPPGRSDAQLDDLNQRLMAAVNATGEVFLSHTRLRDRFTLRLAVGNLRTEERHVARAWELLQREAARLTG